VARRKRARPFALDPIDSCLPGTEAAVDLDSRTEVLFRA
jgi:hypothetical protein